MSITVAAGLSARLRSSSALPLAVAVIPVDPPDTDLSDPYAQIVLGSGPSRFWRFDGTFGAPFLCSITDAVDSYPEPPAAFGRSALPTTATGGSAIDFGGVGSALAAHRSGDDAVVCLIAGWIRPTAAAFAGSHWLLTKGYAENDVAGRGRFILRLAPDGGAAAVLRNGVSGFVTLAAPAGTLAVDEPAHIALRLTATGAQLWINGRFMAATADYTLGLANNTGPWIFAKRLNITPPTLADVEMDEWTVIPGEVTTAEIQALADYVEAVDPGTDVGLAPPAVYQPYQESNADTVQVGSMPALEAAINAAPPGRNILLQPGTYAGGTLNLTPSGADGNPVVVRPRDGYGSVTLTAPTWTIGGQRLVLSKLQMTNPRLTFTNGGQFARVTRCKISDIGRGSLTIATFKNFRADRCDVSDYRSNTNQKHFVLLNNGAVGSGALQNVVIDRNHCYGIAPATGVGAMELIGLTASTAGAAAAFSGFWVERNLFVDISLTSEGELVGSKTSGVVFWRNTVTNGGALYLNCPRQGQRFEVLENWFEDVPTNFVRLFSTESRAIGNRFVGTGRILVCPGDFEYAGTNGNGYARTLRCQVVGNSMGAAGTIRVGDTRASTSPLTAKNNNFFGNTVTGGGDPITFIAGKHEGSTFVNPGIAYEPAVKLTTADVGPLAP